MIAFLPLREIIHAALEDGLELVAGDVLGDVRIMGSGPIIRRLPISSCKLDACY